MSQVKWSLFYSFLQNYAGLALSILATVVLARLLSPAETGLYSIAAAIINILQVLREFGTGPYIIQEPDLTAGKLRGAMTLSLGLGLLLCIVFMASSTAIAGFFGEPRLVLIIRLLSVNFLLVGLTSVSTAQLQRAMRFDALLRISLVQNIVHTAISIALAVRGYGALGMAWAALASSLATMVACASSLGRAFWIRPGLTGWRAPLIFGAYACPGNLLAFMSVRLPDVIIGRLLGFEMAGLFSRGNGLVSLFEQAVMRGIIPVAESAMAERRRMGGDIANDFVVTLRYLTVVGWPCLAMMSYLAGPIILLAFGSVWLPAVPVAQILCGSAGFVVLNTACISLMIATGAARRFLAQQVLSVTVLVAALVLGARLGLAGAAWGVAAWSCLLAGLSLHQARTILKVRLVALLRPLGSGLLVTGLTMIPTALIGARLQPTPILIAELALPAGAAWLGALFLVRHPLAPELVRLAKNLKARLRAAR